MIEVVFSRVGFLFHALDGPGDVDGYVKGRCGQALLEDLTVRSLVPEMEGGQVVDGAVPGLLACSRCFPDRGAA